MSGMPVQVLRFEDAVRSSDPRARTVAKILKLVCALVRVDVAVFYGVDERLEKYAAEPIVSKVNEPLRVGVEEALREYRDRWGKHDPFAPSRVARSNISVLGSGDAPDNVRSAGDAANASCRPAAEMYLRAGQGKIVAGISLLCDPSVPALGLGEISMLRDLHELCEHSYRLVTGAAVC